MVGKDSDQQSPGKNLSVPGRHFFCYLSGGYLGQTAEVSAEMWCAQAAERGSTHHLFALELGLQTPLKCVQ